MNKFTLYAALLVSLSLFAAGCQAPHLEQRTACSAPLPEDAPIVSSGFGMDLHNTRHAQDSSLDSSTVAGLGFKFSVVDLNQESRRGAPGLSDAVAYFTTVHSVFAVNRQSGCVYWRQDYPKEELRSASVLVYEQSGHRQVTVGTKSAQVITLDAATGNPLWSVFAGNYRNGVADNLSMITGGLKYYDGRIYVPIASEEVATAVAQPVCCKTHGALRVLDAATGGEVWAYETTAPAQKQNGDWNKFGPNGVSVWSTPLIDEERRQVLIGTSQNFTEPATDNADSIVALDMDTGVEAWVFKGTLVDFYNASCGQELSPFKHCVEPSYDYDMVTPLLTTTESGQDIVIAADKGGWVYALMPGTGDLIWKRKIGAGGLLGGIHWAVAADSKRVYAGVADFKVPKISILALKLGLVDLLNISPGPVENAAPGLYALALETGDLLWQVNDTHIFEGASYPSVLSAPVTVVNDLVFAGYLDGKLKAYQAVDGTELWAFDTAIAVTDVHGNPGTGGSIDSIGPIVAGDQVWLNSGYSVFNIGGRNAYQAGPGNTLMVFGL